MEQVYAVIIYACGLVVSLSMAIGVPYFIFTYIKDDINKNKDLKTK